ncbi:acyl-CoA thioesterase [Novosphingobium piscinae]|uniref:Thioesterase family protein n=1 Tax=Novosphingobium piscinae TaxID=1507448 RepID=A0A7X1G194_9SPHN|nr:thioesterase family protein [Novosphingobium piscinae]MBC2670142.1 thioesterase family protein [Novosphingobium piscinae]
MSFAAILAGAEALDDGFAVVVPETWMQGRTTYGGFTAALALVAARQVGGELPPLRSAVVSFVGPASGRVEARARELRRGRNAVWVEARVEGEGGTALTATFVFMAAVPSALSLNDAAPPAELIARDEAMPFNPPPLAPAFLRHHLEVRFALPRPAERRADLCHWVRLKPASAVEPMLELVLLADALPPAALPLMNPATPISSMTWQVNLLTAAPQTEDGWWLLRSTADYAQHGCSSQRMQVWNSAGEPMAIGMQSIALFG